MSRKVDLLHNGLQPPSPVTTKFTDKIVIVTGANTGIGYEAALKYVELGASTVIIAVRSLSKGQAAKERIEQKTKIADVVEVWELDMHNFSSVDAFAQRVDHGLPRLDVALLNAGVVSAKYQSSSEGWEKMLQINTLSTALLAILLLPKLKASSTSSSPAHLVNIRKLDKDGSCLSLCLRPSDLQ